MLLAVKIKSSSFLYNLQLFNQIIHLYSTGQVQYTPLLLATRSQKINS